MPSTTAASASPATGPQDTLCGHRAIGGKTCIRERGHDEASHKYAKS